MVYKNTALETLNFSARIRIWRTFNSRFPFRISETTPCDPTSDKSEVAKTVSLFFLATEIIEPTEKSPEVFMRSVVQSAKLSTPYHCKGAGGLIVY